MSDYIKELGMIYESGVIQNTLASRVEDTLEWLLPIEDLEEAEDSCNAELSYIGMGRESIVYSDNGVIIKLNDRNKQEWEPYINKLGCFAQTELYEAEFGLVILQEELTLDAKGFLKNNIRSMIEDCLKNAGLTYDENEITDENVGLTNNGEWKLFDIPVN
jgi:hypothetical protein